MSTTQVQANAASQALPLRSAWSARALEALRSVRARWAAHQRLPEFDAAMLRDLGIDHPPSACTTTTARGDRRPGLPIC